VDLKQIKLVIDLMKRSDLTEFEVEDQGFKLKIKRSSSNGGAPVSYSAQPFPVAVAPAPAVAESVPAKPVAAATPPPAAASSGTDEPGVTYIKSPMVGTFYRSPSPDSPPFADINTKVEEKTVVCIIEAMKIMNEIQAETKGTIVEVLVENGQPVEYGQRLFKVKQG
jgi:acetyl-CoA carboxylase biotin carboxyl carrier protein